LNYAARGKKGGKLCGNEYGKRALVEREKGPFFPRTKGTRRRRSGGGVLLAHEKKGGNIDQRRYGNLVSRKASLSIEGGEGIYIISVLIKGRSLNASISKTNKVGAPSAEGMGSSVILL